MPNPILLDRDRKVRVFSNGTPVSPSMLQSVYAKYLNFVGLTVTENAPLNAYDVTMGATTDELVKAYINAVQVGTVARKLNFSSDFTGTEDAGNNRFNIGLPARILLPDGTTTTKPKVGTFYGGSQGFNGLLAGAFVNADTIATELAATDMYTVFSSDNLDDAHGGFSTVDFITRPAYNPTFRIRFKGNVSTEKMFLGLLSDIVAPVNSSDPVNALSGVAFGYDDSVDTKFVVWNNDGSGASTKTATADNKNTTVHTVTISLTSTTATVIYDGTTILNAVTTNIPASTTNLCLHANMESVGGTVTPLAIAWAYLIQDVWQQQATSLIYAFKAINSD